MKKWLQDKTVQQNIVALTVSGIILITFFYLLREINAVSAALKKLLAILSPFIWGLVFAFFLVPLAKRLEPHFPFKNRSQLRRTLVAIVCILVLILVIALFFAILIPQLINSVGQLFNSWQGYLDGAAKWINEISGSFFLSDEIINDIYTFSSGLFTKFFAWAENYLPNIIATTMATFTGIGNFLIGMVVALYILIDRDHLKRELTKLSMALFSLKNHERLALIVRLSIDKFSNFFIGKIIDSVIIGVLTFIVMTILGLDYSILISFIVGVTNIIPFFGPFIGAIPSILLLLIIDPWQALIFAIAILVIQQLDGNVIGPMILGDSMGLSSLWILFAIIVGGAYMGVLGMIVGVPLFAIIYYLLRDFVNRRLNEKGISYNDGKKAE